MGVVLGGLVVLGLLVVISYNRFVSQQQLIHNAWANVETELRRRYDLVPNLVRTVQGYAAHERGTLEAVVQLIAQTTTQAGLVVEAEADRNCYPMGIKVADEELHAVRLRPETFHGEWDYTIQPKR